MQSSNRDLEAAEASERQQRVHQLARVREGLESEGEMECVDCGALINSARRMAMPSARRCIDCQRKSEQ